MLKIHFITEPFKFQILLEIRHEVQAIGRDVRSLRQEIAELRNSIIHHFDNNQRLRTASNLLDHPIPDALTDKFMIAAYEHKPKIIDSDQDWPVKEGFDALAMNFSRSTFDFHTARRYGRRQAPEAPQYLNLLKSVWIWRQIQKSSNFQEWNRESLWADYMAEMQENIHSQLLRLNDELEPPPSEIVSHLPNSCFAIWVDERPPPPLPLAVPHGKERTILEIALAEADSSRHTTLTLLRRNEVKFRLVQTTRMEDDNVPARERDLPIDMESSRLIPVYANPSTADNPVVSLRICDKDGEFPLEPTFRSFSDVKSLQHALTGFRVNFHAKKLSWWINGSSKENDFGDGKLQLWQPKLLAELPNLQSGVPEPGTANSTPGPDQGAFTSDQAKILTGFSQVSTQIGSSNLQSRKTSSDKSADAGSRKASSSSGRPLKKEMSRLTFESQRTQDSQASGQESEAIAIMRPKNHMLIIFTTYQTKLTFLRVEREQLEVYYILSASTDIDL